MSVLSSVQDYFASGRVQKVLPWVAVVVFVTAGAVVAVSSCTDCGKGPNAVDAGVLNDLATEAPGVVSTFDAGAVVVLPVVDAGVCVQPSPVCSDR